MKKLIFIILVSIPVLNLYSQMEKSERYLRGWEKLKEIDGEAGQHVINSLEDISPDLARFIIEYSFGDVYSLKSLDNKSKEVAAISSLITQGAIPQLKVHLNGALNSGCSVIEVKEIILHTSVYLGFPRCINAMNAFREVVEERKQKGILDIEGNILLPEDNEASRYEKGAKSLTLLNEKQERLLDNTYGDFSPELTQFIIEYGYGDIYSRRSLDERYRQIATIAMLTTLGNASSQLKFHMEGAIHIGISTDEIKEIMLLMTVYAGFPAAINGTNVLKEIVKK